MDGELPRCGATLHERCASRETVVRCGRRARKSMATPPPHVVARSQAHPEYPARARVLDEQVPWSAPWPDYAPTEFIAQHVLANDRTVNPRGWADPASLDAISSAEWTQKSSHLGAYAFDAVGRPVNPRGRTGMSNRGFLGKWGPNHAADPIVTRFHPTGGQLQVVAIERRDNGVVALPGGMVDAGEVVSATVRREFIEECVNLTDAAERAEAERLLNKLFEGAESKVVYRGYVDDPRNTDHSWMETCAFHFHCEGLVAQLQLSAGDDAAHAFWMDVGDANATYAGMMANHKVWVDEVAASMRQK